ncbi:MAG: acyloxyacyl hydrolase [Parvibaculum sp.]|uniref:acyloxyacyl hydrolase n=1 Tax=Parvibaculum sp. TaxID=2024848 RepID=UPI0025FD2CDC|nr:acyloxyacyl hydrolase [Parvibaculum sp.]MCE9648732.1 acyloxyacyl hydrolase [Parvibaculum sp.]
MHVKDFGGCLGVCLAAALLSATAASATEIRLGGYAHDLKVFTPGNERNGLDYNAEILFDSPSWLAWLGAPRPQLGTTISNHGTSMTYAGLDWTVDLSDRTFVDLGLGGAIHDGRLRGYAPEENRYGCRANFHENLSLGYRLTESVSVMATIEHMSNLHLCDYNEGLTNAGIRLGFNF